jgi:hypothetical protein
VNELKHLNQSHFYYLLLRTRKSEFSFAGDDGIRFPSLFFFSFFFLSLQSVARGDPIKDAVKMRGEVEVLKLESEKTRIEDEGGEKITSNCKMGEIQYHKQ